MTYQDNITAVAALQPDYLGFIFYENSPRCFNGIIPKLPDRIKKTGVFVNADLSTVLDYTERHKLNAVQLHGQETPEFCEALKAKAGITIIKVFSIKDHFDFGVLEPYETVCDFFLFDTKGKLPGGNGYTFNWNVLNTYPSTKPFFLSGGIGLEQVEQLKAFQQSDAARYCHTIDVNSRFETAPGLKSIERLEQFIKQVYS